MSIEHVKGNFNAYLQQRMDAQAEAFIDTLEWVGLECLKEMRDPEKRGYKDQTANLRSSTGFLVVANGKIVRSSGFVPETSQETGNTGTTGAAKGSELAESVVQEVGSNGLALILVAGMNYAVYVERMGKNVIDSAKLLARQLVPEMIDAIPK